ncbi:hypothetical protein [Flagellimonas pacifica]|uniref:Uncharacterized protein n=1 Tax=Flagellimonas pacifica TaxID=1247520 RepID=A0A285MCI1_9FLAO|nr:hypothetical protein [Allomuricauda parva]SNY94884.1 hypothetical protein SAMN06265377_0545 [Allomuricauda parva]
MKNPIRIWCLLVLPLLGNSQTPKQPIPKIEIDSIKKIIILDAYNDNYERVWGRRYVIEFHTNMFRLYQLEEYYKNYEFDVDEIEFDSLKILKSKEISKSKAKKMTAQINERNKKRSMIKEKMDSIAWGTSKRPENWNGKRDLGQIDKKAIQVFLSTLNSKSLSPYGYLNTKGIDSIWLKKNVDRLYEKWNRMFPNAKNSSKNNVFFALKDFKLFKKTFFSTLLSRNFTTYPYMEIIIVKKSPDSIKVTSRGQNFFQVPFEINSIKTYNPELAISISKLIPNEKFYSVNKRLNPTWEKIEEQILWNIGDAYRNKKRK